MAALATLLLLLLGGAAAVSAIQMGRGRHLMGKCVTVARYADNCAVWGTTCDNYNSYLVCDTCKTFSEHGAAMWKDANGQCNLCVTTYNSNCLDLLDACSTQNKYQQCAPAACKPGSRYESTNGICQTCVARSENTPNCKRFSTEECKSTASELKCAECEGGYFVSSGGTCSKCTDQQRCSASDSSAACVPAVGTTAPNKYFCTATTTPGYWVDSGVVKPCTTQPLCQSDASPKVCVPATILAPGNQLKCQTCKPGYWLDENGVCGCAPGQYMATNGVCKQCTDPWGQYCAEPGRSCPGLNRYRECITCKPRNWKDMYNHCKPCKNDFNNNCKEGALLDTCSSQNNYVQCAECKPGFWMDLYKTCRPCVITEAQAAGCKTLADTCTSVNKQRECLECDAGKGYVMGQYKQCKRA